MVMELPSIGLGTWQNTNPEQCRDSVKNALNTGYRHIDTAQAYKNEESVGKGIQASDLNREEVFLASKVWNTNLSKRDVISSTNESLDKLDTEYIDLMYVHWPAPEYSPESTLQGFQALKNRGLIKEIGVSNFTPALMEEAMEHVEVYANQVEMHPLLPQNKLLEACKELGVELVAYSPLARGEVFNVPEIQQIAEKHGVSEAQVSLAWIMRKGATPIPKASSMEHIKDNFKARKLELDGEDIEKIDSIQSRYRKADPDFGPWS